MRLATYSILAVLIAPLIGLADKPGEAPLLDDVMEKIAQKMYQEHAEQMRRMLQFTTTDHSKAEAKLWPLVDDFAMCVTTAMSEQAASQGIPIRVLIDELQISLESDDSSRIFALIDQSGFSEKANICFRAVNPSPTLKVE